MEIMHCVLWDEIWSHVEMFKNPKPDGIVPIDLREPNLLFQLWGIFLVLNSFPNHTNFKKSQLSVFHSVAERKMTPNLKS